MQMEKAAAPATDYLHMEEPQPAGFKAGLSPKFVDSVLAGGALAATSSLLHLTDILLGDYAPPFFCVPLLPSGLLFFAGPVPPPAKAFFLCTIIAWISGYLIYLSGPEDNGFKACLVAGVLLKLFKTSNNFFVPTVGLAATLLSDPTKYLSSPLGALKFLFCPWLLGHALLYAAAHGAAIMRKRVRMQIKKREFKARFANLGDAELRRVFLRYDTSGDGFLQAGELKYAWQAATGEPMTEEDAEDLVKSIDADGNGEIDVDEFIALVRDQM
jgi:hypothetical protein